MRWQSEIATYLIFRQSEIATYLISGDSEIATSLFGNWIAI